MKKSNTLFTIQNNDGQFLKYLMKNETGEFNQKGSQLRFHTCNTEKQAEKILQRLNSEGYDNISIVEVTSEQLQELRTASKDLPRLRNRKFPEPKAAKDGKKKEKKVKEDKPAKPAKEKKSKKASTAFTPEEIGSTGDTFYQIAV